MKTNKKIIHTIIFILCIIFLFINYIPSNFFKINLFTEDCIFFKNWIYIYFVPILLILYLIFFIYMFFNSKNKNKVFIFWIFLFLFMSYRNLFDYYFITYKWLNDFTFQSEKQKTFYLYDNDYLVFTDKVRNYLYNDFINKSKECKIYIFSDNTTLENYWKLVYLRPCNIINKIENSDYIIYYKEKLPYSLKNKVVLNYRDNYLVKMK